MAARSKTAVPKQEEKRMRNERMGFRIDPETKDLIERAAAIEHRKITDFCVSAIKEAAWRTVADQETMVLRGRDREIFFEALMNPPEPNERLKRAMKEHAARVVSR